MRSEVIQCADVLLVINWFTEYLVVMQILKSRVMNALKTRCTLITMETILD